MNIRTPVRASIYVNRTCSDPNDIIETDHYIITYPEVGTSAGRAHV